MQFQFLKDPLFLASLVIYLANKWIAKPYFPNSFSSNYLNDLICIPFWVTIMLWFMSKLRLRKGKAPPDAIEIAVPLVIWSWVFEAFLPRTALFKGLEVSDHVDILCYAVGGLLAGVFWKVWYGRTRAA
jgi:hypothetical protein